MRYTSFNMVCLAVGIELYFVFAHFCLSHLPKADDFFRPVLSRTTCEVVPFNDPVLPPVRKIQKKDDYLIKALNNLPQDLDKSQRTHRHIILHCHLKNGPLDKETWSFVHYFADQSIQGMTMEDILDKVVLQELSLFANEKLVTYGYDCFHGNSGLHSFQPRGPGDIHLVYQHKD